MSMSLFTVDVVIGNHQCDTRMRLQLRKNDAFLVTDMGAEKFAKAMQSGCGLKAWLAPKQLQFGMFSEDARDGRRVERILRSI